MVPLSLVVTQKEQAVLQTISRVDRERAIGISGNVAPGHSQAEAMDKVAELSKDLPVGYRTVASGQASQLAETTSGLSFALLIGILVAYMVLASQFNSFLHPITVLTILPLAVSGAAIGLSPQDLEPYETYRGRVQQAYASINKVATATLAAQGLAALAYGPDVSNLATVVTTLGNGGTQAQVSEHGR